LDSISGATNARSGCFFLLERAESVSNPKYKGFSDFLEFAGGGARVQNSPVVAIALISADAWHGDSTTAMTALFLVVLRCWCGRVVGSGIRRSGRSIR
jgi:hypothetical protein